MKTEDRFPPNHSKIFLDKKIWKIVGGMIFFIGLMIGFGFNGLAVIADLNSAGFWGDSKNAADLDQEQPTQANLVKLSCPILLAPGEEGVITASFRNPHQEGVDIPVKAVVSKSDFLNFREEAMVLSLEPGVKQDFEWKIDEKDIIQENLILTRVFLINEDKSTPYPARTKSCGVYIIDFLGLKGATITALLFMTSLLGMVIGSILLYSRNSPLNLVSPRIDHGLYALGVIVLINMIISVLGIWVVSGLIFLMAVLFSFVLIGNFITFGEKLKRLSQHSG